MGRCHQAIACTRDITYQAQPENHAAPEAHVVERLAAADPLCPLQDDDGKLQHLTDKAVAAQFLGDTCHDNFVADRADQKGDDGGISFANVRAAGAVNVAAEEAVDGHVPLARELHPVGAVPPVAIEVPVGEACDLGAGAEHVLEDDEENEQKG